MMELGPLQTSDTGPRSRSKPSFLSAAAIVAVAARPTGIGSQGTELIAMQTPPPSWSVAAMRRWCCALRTFATRAVMAAAVDALRFRFTTSSPPNWRRFQSARTASVRLPLKPTMITAPISSSSVKPPGPSRSEGLEEAEGEDVVDGVGEETDTGREPTQEITNDTRTR